MCTQWRKAHSGGDPSKQLSQETRGVYGYTLVQIACTPLWRGGVHHRVLGIVVQWEKAVGIRWLPTLATLTTPGLHQRYHFTTHNHTLPKCFVPYHFVTILCLTTAPSQFLFIPQYHSTRFTCHCTVCTVVQDCHCTTVQHFHVTVPQYKIAHSGTSSVIRLLCLCLQDKPTLHTCLPHPSLFSLFRLFLF